MVDYEVLEKGILRICEALVNITDHEGSDYGYGAEVDMAEEYIKDYKEAHPDE